MARRDGDPKVRALSARAAINDFAGPLGRPVFAVIAVQLKAELREIGLGLSDHLAIRLMPRVKPDLFGSKRARPHDPDID